MALTTSELRRLRYELGYNVLNAGAEPYIGVSAVFEQVIQTYLQSGAITTSNTSVTAATAPTPAVLTLADSTGFANSNVVIVDVDSRQERVTVEQVSGSTIRVILSKAHSGTYPVTVEGGESIVRTILGHLYDCEDKILASSKTAGLKSVGRGAVEWYGNSTGGSVLQSLKSLQMYWRDQLASALGVANLWRYRSGNGASELY